LVSLMALAVAVTGGVAGSSPGGIGNIV
jgi:hypothetical protein